MNRTSRWLSSGFFFVALVGLFACGDDVVSGDGGADIGPGDVSVEDVDLAVDAQTDAAVDDGGPEDATTDSRTPDAGPPIAAQHVVVGHLLGDSAQLDQFDINTLNPSSASPAAVPVYNDMIGLPDLDAIAVVIPGGPSMAVLSRDGLSAMAGSPYSQTTVSLTLGYDQTRHRLYVYGASGASSRTMTVYDTTAMPFVEIDGSPFSVGLVATEIEVDESTGRIFGVSSSTLWAAEIVDDTFTMLFDTPLSDDNPTGLALDHVRRRLYYTSTVPSRVFARDLDTFEQIDGSPVSLPGDFPSGVVVNGDTGDVFVLDGSPAEGSSPTTLHLVRSAPFALANTCGSEAGCDLPPTETGIAIDSASERLFITVNLEGRAGRLSVWDISTPSMPSETTTADTRPTVGEFPAWVFVY